MLGAKLPFDLDQLEAIARNTYLAVARAEVEERPDPVRHLMTDRCWERLCQRINTMRLDGARQHMDRILITDASLREWGQDGADHNAVIRLLVSGVRYVDGADGRLVSGARTTDQWAEDWRFVRSRDPEVLKQAESPRCPACGAPLEIDDGGLCKFCRAVVPGAKSDWLLDDMAGAVDDPWSGAELMADANSAFKVVAEAAISDAPPGASAEPRGPAVDPAAVAGLRAIEAVDQGFKVGDVAPIAREAFLALQRARGALDPIQARAWISDELYAAEVAAARAARGSGRHEVEAFLDLDSVEVVAAAADPEWHRLAFRVDYRAARHVVDLGSGSVVEGDDVVRPRQAELSFFRRAGARTDAYREPESGVCPACSVPLQVGEDGRCAACGAHLTGGELGWILGGIAQPAG